MPERTLDLFPGARWPIGRAVPRPRRVFGWLIDSGDHMRAYRCKPCGLEWTIATTDAEDAAAFDHFHRYGTNLDARCLCPTCNAPEVLKAWGTAPDKVPDPAPMETAMSDLRALTLHRVWAGMVALGWKPYEFRNARLLALIGQRVAIHAGHKEGRFYAACVLLDPTGSKLGGLGPAHERGMACLSAAPAGHIIATAVVGRPIDLHADPLADAEPSAGGGAVVPCQAQADARQHLPLGYEHTRWAIPLLEVRQLAQPVLCRGSVTLGWRVPDDVAALVRAQGGGQ